MSEGKSLSFSMTSSASQHTKSRVKEAANGQMEVELKLDVSPISNFASDPVLVQPQPHLAIAESIPEN